MSAERVELRITGRVQGVYYRASCAEAARQLGLVGWVRNVDDGSVEAVAEGPHEALESFLAWCRRGPPAARVDDVEVRTLAPEGQFDSFEVRR